MKKQYNSLFSSDKKKEYNGKIRTPWEISNQKMADGELFMLNSRVRGDIFDVLEAFKAVYNIPRSFVVQELLEAGIKVKSDELEAKTGMSIVDVMSKYSVKSNIERRDRVENIAKNDKKSVANELFAIPKTTKKRS